MALDDKQKHDQVSFPKSTHIGCRYAVVENNHAFALLQGAHPNRTDVSNFKSINMPADGSCGFHALGLSSRESFVATLLSHADEREYRAVLQEEIYFELSDDETDFSTSLGAFRDAVINEKIEAEINLDDVARELRNKWGGDYAEIKGADAKVIEMIFSNLIIAFPNDKAMRSAYTKIHDALEAVSFATSVVWEVCGSKEVYQCYVNMLLKPEAWLGKKAALLYARAMNFSLYIWEPMNNKVGAIDCGPQDRYVVAGATEHHIYYDQSSHYKRLTPIRHDEIGHLKRQRVDAHVLMDEYDYVYCAEFEDYCKQHSITLKNGDVIYQSEKGEQVTMAAQMLAAMFSQALEEPAASNMKHVLAAHQQPVLHETQIHLHSSDEGSDLDSVGSDFSLSTDTSGGSLLLYSPQALSFTSSVDSSLASDSYDDSPHHMSVARKL